MVPIKQAIFQRLKVLSLRDNCLTDVPTEAFTCMYQLETLILSHVSVARQTSTLGYPKRSAEQKMTVG